MLRPTLDNHQHFSVAHSLVTASLITQTTESWLFPTSQFPFSPLVSRATVSNTASSPRSLLSSPMLRGRSFLKMTSCCQAMKIRSFCTK